MSSGARAGDDQLWAAVGDPRRRRVLDLLLARGQAPPTALAKPAARSAAVSWICRMR